MKRLAFISLSLLVAGSALAQNLPYSTSFEPPTWLTTQTDPFLSNGWTRPSGSAAQFGLGTTAFDGVQSARFNQQTANSTNYSVASPTIGTSVITKAATISAKLFVEGDLSGTTTSATTTGRQFGLQTSGGSATTYVLLERTSNTSADLDVYISPRNSFTFTKVATLSNLLNTWVDLSLTFDAVNFTASASVNGNNYILNTPANFGSATGIYDVDNGNLFARGAASSRGRAFFDSYSQVAPVPEPATMAALGLGALALIKRRRKG